MKVAGCVLFNHPFPSNIPKLRKIYEDTFDDLLFVQPIEPSEDSDVVTVFRGSYAFHGMIVDVAPRLLDTDADYFVFVHDDVLLNPRWDGRGLVERLQVPGNGAFMRGMWPLNGEIQKWSWQPGFIWKLLYPLNVLSGSGLNNLLRYLPDAERMRQMFAEKYGFVFEDMFFGGTLSAPHTGLVEDPAKSARIMEALLEGLRVSPKGKDRIELPYPFCGGSGDFFVLDRATFERVIPLLGVMAAADLFVEIAIPTAVLSVADKVTTSDEVGLVSTMVWTKQEYDAVTDEDIVNGFESDWLLFHPAKLSGEFDRFARILASVRA